jgi:2-methylcitrate dehydratase PrpD
MDHAWQPVVQWLFDVHDRIPSHVEKRTRLLVLDTIACAVAGLRHTQVAALADISAELSPGNARFPGLPSLFRSASASASDANLATHLPTSAGLTPGAAAAVFTAAACWDEFCEGHDRARGRPGLHSVGLPVVLAAQRGLTVGEVLFAVLAGYEVGARFGAALFTREGLHVDGTWGTAAAAAASAVALGLDSRRTAEAVGIATATPLASLYLSVPRGETARNIYAARGVAGGLECAVAAASGITAPDGALAATVGLLGRVGSHAEVVAPGEFLLTSGYLKPWPGVRHAHYAIAAALKVRDQLAAPGSEPADDDPITLVMHPAAVEYAGVRAPRTRLQAQFSCTYAAAHALVTGDFGLTAATSEAIDDPVVGALEQRIDLVPGEPGGRYADLAVGPYRARVRWAPGDPGHALSSADVKAKAMALMSPRLGAESAADLTDWILTAEPQSPWQPPV